VDCWCGKLRSATRSSSEASPSFTSHDLVVIDTAGAASQATIFAIGCADLVLVPIAPSSADIVEAIKLPDLRHVLANCPKAKSHSINDRCNVRYGEDSRFG
jgi:cellulose biosynthesis protein BcsQ